MTLTDALRQFVENALFSMHITSAGGDSPKINTVRDVDINPADFENIIRTEVENILNERLDEEGSDLGLEDDAGSSNLVSEAGIAGGVRQGIGIAKNPMGILTKFMGFLPHTALIALAVMLIPMIIDLLKAPGMPMDTRFKRVMEDEENAFLDRQTQRNTMIGLRQVIVQSKAGFIMANGAQNENTLRQIREGDQSKRLANIDFTDHARSLF